MKQYNEKFSLSAVKAENLHRTLNVQAPRLADILCHREQRYVGQQLTLAYDRKQITWNEVIWRTVWQVSTSRFMTSQIGRLRSAGRVNCFPNRVFSKDQRVSHTAIVENKRLRHALTTVKSQQDTKHLPQILTNSAKNGYKKNPRSVYGPDYKAKIAPPPAVEMTA